MLDRDRNIEDLSTISSPQAATPVQSCGNLPDEDCAMLRAEAPENREPKIVAFLCNWCSYAGADLAGTGRIQYPPNVRVIRVPCSGRVDPLMILRCLQRGADGVLVSGCHPGDCHYIAGNYLARRKFVLLDELLDFFGIEKGRVHFSWVSAAEGEKFADVVKQVTETVKALGKPTKLVR